MRTKVMTLALPRSRQRLVLRRGQSEPTGRRRASRWTSTAADVARQLCRPDHCCSAGAIAWRFACTPPVPIRTWLIVAIESTSGRLFMTA